MTTGVSCGGKAVSSAGLWQHPAEFAASVRDAAVALYSCQISGLNDINWVGNLAIYCPVALMDEVVGDLSWIWVKGNRGENARSLGFLCVGDIR